MNTTSTPWYKSDILRGILVAVLSQVIAHSKLATIVTSDQIGAVVNYILDGISAAGAYWAVHSRVTKPVLPISGTKLAAKTDAAIANAQVPTPVPVAVAVPVVVTSGDTDEKTTVFPVTPKP